ncbi:MAG: 8-oxo-dGTP diphosphatase [Candidatus Taylorbacteria bacterium]|nr:8-oxo-dGTP diphosphatase [Candidatus Taylorbacteria bacterium]
MRNSTLLFLVKSEDGKVGEICLAMKKRGFGAGRWNGAGGKANEGETVEAAALRETEEEIGVRPKSISKVAELHFTFANKPEWDQVVHAYLCFSWEGEPVESEEMAPRWFKTGEIPYKEMWPDDVYWLPKVISGKLIRKAEFEFGEGDIILRQDVEEVGAP